MPATNTQQESLIMVTLFPTAIICSKSKTSINLISLTRTHVTIADAAGETTTETRACWFNRVKQAEKLGYSIFMQSMKQVNECLTH